MNSNAFCRVTSEIILYNFYNEDEKLIALFKIACQACCCNLVQRINTSLIRVQVVQVYLTVYYKHNHRIMLGLVPSSVVIMD